MHKIEMQNSDYYRAKCLECSELAARVKDPISAVVFRVLAADYFKLAAKNAGPNVASWR